MLGAFCPLIHYLITNKIKDQKIELRDFGPMNRHVLDLPYLQANNVAVSFNENLSPKDADVVLDNLDVVNKKKSFHKVISIATKHLIENFADSSDSTDVLVVDRGLPREGYEKINHRSGILRRSVPNMKSFYNHIADIGSTKFVRLENTTLKKNVSLFHHTDCVVAQHGGALTNTIFMQSHAEVIEIRFGHRGHFFYLCEHLGLSHQFFGPTSGKNNPAPRIDKEALKRKIWRIKLL